MILEDESSNHKPQYLIYDYLGFKVIFELFHIFDLPNTNRLGQ